MKDLVELKRSGINIKPARYKYSATAAQQSKIQKAASELELQVNPPKLINDAASGFNERSVVVLPKIEGIKPSTNIVHAPIQNRARREEGVITNLRLDRVIDQTIVSNNNDNTSLPGFIDL